MTKLPPSSRASKPASSPYWMLLEIGEQSDSIRETVRRHVTENVIFAGALDRVEDPAVPRKIIIAASGSSRHAGLVGEIMMEDLAGAEVEVEYASEYCYRSADSESDSLVLLITQSGETADTIAAQREARKRGAETVAISNVAGSTIGRAANATLLTYAGPERAVPATKSFITQLTVLYLLSLYLAQKRGRMNSAMVGAHLERLSQIPNAIEASLAHWQIEAEAWARASQSAKAFLFLGRGVHYAIAREGALKLKETSYVQAEGLPTGELRHGTNALVDDGLAVVLLCTRDATVPDSMLRYEKSLSVLENVRSRGGKTMVIASQDDHDIAHLADYVIAVPGAPELLMPLLEVVPLQLFAYYFALLNGRDVDSPRNLAKAVLTE